MEKEKAGMGAGLGAETAGSVLDMLIWGMPALYVEMALGMQMRSLGEGSRLRHLWVLPR